MSEQQSIRDGMRRDVSRAVMLGAGLAKPAWAAVPVDDCEPTGEMKSVVSTDVTPFVIFLTDVILASPVIRRIQADAWDNGWRRGFADCDGEIQKADNPHQEGAADV